MPVTIEHDVTNNQDPGVLERGHFQFHELDLKK